VSSRPSPHYRASPLLPQNGKTPLHLAACHDHCDVMTVLIDTGAVLEKMDKQVRYFFFTRTLRKYERAEL